MWLQGYGQSAKQDTRQGIKGFDSGTLGLAVGADTSAICSNGTIGIAINHSMTVVNSKNANTTHAEVGNYGFTLYGTRDFSNNNFARAQAGFALNLINATRHNAGGPGLEANGSYYSQQYAAKILAGHDFTPTEGMTLTPTADVSYTNLQQPGYTETGTSTTLLSVKGSTFNMLKGGVGLDAGWKMQDKSGNMFKPVLRAGYEYDVLGKKVEATSDFVGGGPSFNTTGASPARNIFTAGAQATYITTANWDFSAKYDYTYKTDYQSHAGTLRATMHF
jgi:outer membrane autotransporter protein